MRSGRPAKELAPLQKATFVETLNFYGRISNLDNVNTCDLRLIEAKNAETKGLCW